MAARVRWRGTTAQRGYGTSHQRERRRLLALWRPGQPCARCGQPIWVLSVTTARGPRVSVVDLGHTPGRDAYTGLEHRWCNRAEGATRGNQSRGQAKRWAAARIW
jgi:hypothetical protein